MVTIPPIVSVDDHVLEPPDLWQRWLSEKWRERGPRVIEAPYEMTPHGRQQFRIANDGPVTDFWAFEDLRVGVVNAQVAAGMPGEEIVLSPIRFSDIRPSCYDPTERLVAMDENNVERSLCFPNTLPRFCGQTFFEAKDRDLGAACVVAYNDWIVDEWCGDSGGRLLPLCLIPLWDPVAAGAEVRRNAARGVKAVSFTEVPPYLGMPSLYDRDRFWDPFFQACDETGTVICMHIGSSSTVKTADDAPPGTGVALLGYYAQLGLADWLLSGVLARFSNLRIAFSEGQIGWIPYLLERLDNTWKKERRFAGFDPAITEPPSHYMAKRVYGCFFEDEFGVWARDWVGQDLITFETDFPHQDSTFPDTVAYLETIMSDLRQDEVDRFVRGNAIEMLSLPSDIGYRPKAGSAIGA